MLYVILGVLVLVGVVPMYFYSAQVESINRDRLITNERLLQNTVTRSLADDISQHQQSLRMMQANLSSALQVASGPIATIQIPIRMRFGLHGNWAEAADIGLAA